MDTLDRIKYLCEIKSITIAELERNLGFGNGTVRKWGKTLPSADKLQKVARFLGVTVDYLLGNEEPYDKISEYEAQNKIFFSKFGRLSEKDRAKIIKIIEMFEEETQQ